MFDVSSGELGVIAIIALLVLGPERLPGAARVAGALLRRARNAYADVRDQVERELAAEELKRSIHSVGEDLKQPISEAQQALTVPIAEARQALESGDGEPEAAGSTVIESGGATEGAPPADPRVPTPPAS